MPPELFNGLAPGVRTAARPPRSWRTLPLSIAAHFVVLLVLLISPLAAEVTLPDPVPIRPLQVVLAHAVPEVPQPPSQARQAAPARDYAPTVAPPAILPERPLAPPVPSEIPVDPNGLPPGFGSDPGAIPLHIDGPPSPPPPPAPKTPPMVRISTGMQAPQKIVDVKPVYPALAKAAHVEGIVILDAVLGTDGRVDQVRVLRSVALLDQAAIDAVRQWRYTPTRLNGEPVRVLMTITMNFKLE